MGIIESNNLTRFVVFILFFSCICCSNLEERENFQYVNQFIGTSDSDRPSLWESNGGTYPGAAVPFGMVQATPNNYKYDIMEIKSFSLLNHTSGYPKGSAGDFHIMPFTDVFPGLENLVSSFTHDKEEASPGYYSVLLEDLGTQAEMTVTKRNALMKFTYSSKVKMGLSLHGVSSVKKVNGRTLTGKCGRHFFVIEVNHDTNKIEIGDDRTLIEISDSESLSFMVKVGFSTNTIENAILNQQTELPKWDLIETKQKAKELWRKYLDIIEIEGGSESDKEIFFSALYHSFLDPHIISDAKEEERFSGLSPWDTYHSKQPLITLLAPEVQANMIRSVLDVFDRSGKMSPGPMTGDHNVPILLDSYRKGVDIDTEKAYRAMEASLLKYPYSRRDMELFVNNPFVPAETGYSVTKTLEYAYDYWAMAEMAGELENTDDIDFLSEKSHAYNNIYNPSTGFMTARSLDGNWSEGGYREGDKWAYNWSVTHDVHGLINLAGGNDKFSDQLEESFEKGYYYHDNEPPIHNPYLFIYAGKPWKTQKFVRKILRNEYSNSPGGLPGNDDLGALSAWYVFSAMGFYPVCPGRPEYVLGSPLFDKVMINLPNAKKLVIEANNVSAENVYVQSISYNNQPYKKLFIDHSTLMEGGHIVFDMGAYPVEKQILDAALLPESMTTTQPKIELTSWSLEVDSVSADEEIVINANLINKSKAIGTTELMVQVNGDKLISERVLVHSDEYKTEEIQIRLYEPGSHSIAINNGVENIIYIKPGTPPTFIYGKLELPSPPITSIDSAAVFSTSVKNIGNYTGMEKVSLVIDGAIVETKNVEFKPGQSADIFFSRIFTTPAVHQVKIGALPEQPFLVYGKNMKPQPGHKQLTSPLVSLSFNIVSEDINKSQSFIMHGDVSFIPGIFGDAIQTDATKNIYIEIPSQPSHTEMDKGRICTMMLWVYPMDERNFSDILSRGDLNVIQVRASNTEANYYSGGWQRGEAYTLLSDEWNRKWHHIAGVSSSKDLKLYIDGKLRSQKDVEMVDEERLNKIIVPWNIGRNAQNTDRSFNGLIDEVKIFDKSLSQEEVLFHMLNIEME